MTKMTKMTKTTKRHIKKQEGPLADAWVAGYLQGVNDATSKRAADDALLHDLDCEHPKPVVTDEHARAASEGRAIGLRDAADALNGMARAALAASQGPEPGEPDHVIRLCAAVVHGAWELPDDDGEACKVLAVRARQQWDACREALRVAGLPRPGGGVRAPQGPAGDESHVVETPAGQVCRACRSMLVNGEPRDIAVQRRWAYAAGLVSEDGEPLPSLRRLEMTTARAVCRPLTEPVTSAPFADIEAQRCRVEDIQTGTGLRTRVVVPLGGIEHSLSREDALWLYHDLGLAVAESMGPRYVTAAEIERDHDNARALADAARDYSEAFEDADGEEEEAPVHAAFSALLDAARRWMAPAVAAHQGPEPARLSTPEPAPKRTDGAPVWDLVVADMRQRDAEGRRKYGTPLQAFNGRRPLVDAYQEALDLVVYLRQEIEERASLEQRQAMEEAMAADLAHVEDIDHAIALASAALTFGQVQRATLHPDGTPESDATHTVMLALLVADVAAREGLDVGLAVQFALVHDLPEVYAGDTCTARGLSPDAAAEKAAREAASLERLRAELGPCWTTDMVDRYEAQREPEARLVRYLDKVLPKLTHVLNGGLALAEIGMSAREVETKHAEQGAKLRALYPEMIATRALFDEACALALDAMRKREAASTLPDGGTSCPDCKGTGVLHFAGETDPTSGVTERLQEPCHCTEGAQSVAPADAGAQSVARAPQGEPGSALPAGYRVHPLVGAGWHHVYSPVGELVARRQTERAAHQAALSHCRTHYPERLPLTPAAPQGGDAGPPFETWEDDTALVRRAVANLGGRPRPRWSHVARAFGLGSTFAARLCGRLGLDPDETIGESYEAASPLPKNGPEPSIAALPDTDAMLLCAHGCGEVPHRFRPSPEAGPYWRCSECGEITPAIKVRTIGGMIDQRALFAERYGDEGGPTEPVNESEVGP